MSILTIHNTFQVEIKNGKSNMPYHEKVRYDHYVRARSNGLYELIIRKHRKFKNRSLAQNAYYHGVVLKLISDYTGHDPDDLHEEFLAKFSCELNDIGLPHITRSKHMTTEEFAIYVENIRSWAAMYLGLNIPDPKPHDIPR